MGGEHLAHDPREIPIADGSLKDQGPDDGPLTLVLGHEGRIHKPPLLQGFE